MDDDATGPLLDRFHAGDDEALRQLLMLHLPAIRDMIHRRLPRVLRRDADTMDIVQDVAIEVLKGGPRFRAREPDQFRALLARMVANRLCDRLRYQQAERRAPRSESGSIDDTVVDLAPADQRPGPRTEAGRRELEAEIRLAIELLPTPARQLILWRDFEKLPHKEIGERLGITADAAHMRCSAAHDRLAATLTKLRSGQLDESLLEDPE